MVEDLLHSDWTILELYAQIEWLQKIELEKIKPVTSVHEIPYRDLKKISNLASPHNVIAVVKMPDVTDSFSPNSEDLIIALDGIQDPGNMGTIIRTANWFGIDSIICSETCVDIYNPKVIQASMSGFIGLKILNNNLEEALILGKKKGLRIFGTFPEGKSIYDFDLPQGGILIFGNESKGLSPVLTKIIDYKISIPAIIKKLSPSVESLNVATAAGIICAEFRN